MPLDILHPDNRNSSRNALILWVIVGALMAPGAIFWAMDNWNTAISYIPHTETTDVYFKSDWMQGENKVCSGVMKNPPQDSELRGLDCPANADTGGSTHNLSIMFYGRTNRRDLSLNNNYYGRRFQWRCHRGTDSFTCYALN